MKFEKKKVKPYFFTDYKIFYEENPEKFLKKH